MYTILHTQSLSEYPMVDCKKAWLKSICYKIEGQECLPVFLHKLEARLFLAINNYLLNTPMYDYAEIPVSDYRAQSLMQDQPDNSYILIKASSSDKERAEYKLVSLNEVINPMDAEIRKQQEFYNSLSDEEIDALIDKKLFNSDCSKKLIQNAKTLAVSYEEGKKEYNRAVYFLASKGIHRLPLYILAYPTSKDHYVVASVDDNVAIFANILDAYLGQQVPPIQANEKKDGVEYKVYNLSALNCRHIRKHLLNHYLLLGDQEISVIQGFQAQPDSEHRLHLVGTDGNPLLCCEKHNISVLKTGYCSVAPLVRALKGRSPEEQEEVLERFLSVQNDPPELLKSKAIERANFYFQNLRVLNPALPISAMALY